MFALSRGVLASVYANGSTSLVGCRKEETSAIERIMDSKEQAAPSAALPR
jgi:hypothetical protein